mgnify:CR=1 FL=1
MLLPSIWGERRLNNWFDDLDDMFDMRPMYAPRTNNFMSTDIKENENGYEMAVDLPGFNKNELKLELTEGYLTITASRNRNNDQKDEKTGKVIRQERYSGTMTRRYYVGEDLTEEDIKAKFENGVLTLDIPKKEKVEKMPEKKYISIEG